MVVSIIVIAFSLLFFFLGYQNLFNTKKVADRITRTKPFLYIKFGAKYDSKKVIYRMFKILGIIIILMGILLLYVVFFGEPVADPTL